MKEALKSIQVKLFLVFLFTILLCSITTRVNGEYGVIDGKAGNALILLTFFANALFNSLFLAEYDIDKVINSHFSRTIFRLVLFSFFPVILTIQSGDYSNLLLIFYSLSIFYFFFELLLNHFSNRPTFYIGSTATNDKIVRWINNKFSFMMELYPIWYIIFKFLLFILSVTLLRIYWI